MSMCNKPFRVKVNTVFMYAISKQDRVAKIPGKFMHFINVETVCIVKDLIKHFRSRFNLQETCLKLYLEDYLLQEDDPIQVLKEDDCLTLSIHKDDEGRNDDATRESQNVANGLNENHETMAPECSEASFSKKTRKRRHEAKEHRETETSLRDSSEIETSSPHQHKAKKRKKKDREKQELEKEEMSCSGNKREKGKCSGKELGDVELAHNDRPLDEDSDREKKKKRREKRKKKIEAFVVSGNEENDSPEQAKRFNLQGKRSKVPKLSSERTEDEVVFNEKTGSSCQEENEMLHLRDAESTPQVEVSKKSMWDVRPASHDVKQPSMSSEEQFSFTGNNFWDKAVVASTSLEDVDAGFIEKKKRRRRRKKKQDKTPVENEIPNQTTVFLRNPTLFVPPAQKAGRKKGANSTSKHTHFDGENKVDEPNAVSEDQCHDRTGHMSTFDLNVSDISVTKEDKNSPSVEEKTPKPPSSVEEKTPKPSLLTMLPPSVSMFKKQPVENVKLVSQTSSGSDVVVDDASKEVDEQTVPMEDHSLERTDHLKDYDASEFKETIYADMSFQSPVTAKNTNHGRVEEDNRRNQSREESSDRSQDNEESSHRSQDNEESSHRSQDNEESSHKNQINKEHHCKTETIDEDRRKNETVEEDRLKNHSKKENLREDCRSEATEFRERLVEADTVLPSNTLPRKGWFLSFRMLELSPDGCSEVSDVKNAEVIDVDEASKSVTLNCISKFAQRRKGESFACVEELDSSTENNCITLNWGDVIEPRQLLAYG